MKTVIVLFLTAMSVIAQSRFKLESTNGKDPTKIAKGSVKEEPSVYRFTSEDGTVEFTYPRLDLVKPTVNVFVSGDEYTYVVTNGAEAKANLEGIRFAPPFRPDGIEELVTPKGFIFGITVWMPDSDSNGLAPGQTAVFKVRQKQFSHEMLFSNSAGDIASLPELPDNMPVGLMALFGQWMRAHRGVTISGIEPVTEGR